MKLRNKKTGEIADCNDFEYDLLSTYNSLAELNEDWEDYKELLKPYWFINDLNGEPMQSDWQHCHKDEFREWAEQRKQIGNYFETKEQAEKALEKLKAWKRLKDKKFRFTGINDAEESQIMIYQCGILCEANIEYRLSKDEDFILLFDDVDNYEKKENPNATQTNQR